MQTFDNYSYFDGVNIKPQQQISISNEKISEIRTSEQNKENTDLIIPGFVDLQIYGAGGKLFSAEPTEENIASIEDDLLAEGTTSFLICLATNTPQVFDECIRVIKNHQNHSRNCLGLHLEGPFINPEKRGAHVKEYIRKATLDEVKKLLTFGDGCIKMMTLAPELQDDEVIQYLLDNDVVVSLGHSSATFEQATKAYHQGVQTTTHLFNAMSPLQHRAPGIPTAVFNHPSAMASIIADGHHVDFEVVKLAAKVMKERLFLITDAVTECTSGPYQHHEIDGKFVMKDGTLSGSALSMLQAVRNCIAHADVSVADAINMATYYPAKLIKKEKEIGKLVVNATANMVILNKDLELKNIFFKGEEIKPKKHHQLKKS